MNTALLTRRKAMVQTVLEQALSRLQTQSGLAPQLTVVWTPNNRHHLSGEVKESTIYIYESDASHAMNSLWHEFFDFCISQAIEPYKDLVNLLINERNQQAYQIKERMVEELLRLVAS
jgi:hypothetical protein